jgi:hypothetical protein
MREIKEGSVYNVDLGSLSLFTVKVIKVYETKVLVEFVDYIEKGSEILPKEVFL